MARQGEKGERRRGVKTLARKGKRMARSGRMWNDAVIDTKDVSQLHIARVPPWSLEVVNKKSRLT
jgi:hypothetical protein